MRQKTAAIVVIGNEILTGKSEDKNASFLIGELRGLGVALRRVIIVPDDVDTIAKAVRECASEFDHVFTSGGVGPTHDDVTIEAIARAFDRAVVRHPELEAMLRGYFGDDADAARMIGYAEALLHSVLPERDPLAEQAAALVSRITDDPGLRRVDQLAASSGMTPRTLQRLFADYVGVSPKWVMRRARLHEAAERAGSGEPVDWAALASDLGYADQAHLTRDFTVTILVPPTRYAAAPLFDPAAGIVLSFVSGRPWAPSRAALMSFLTSAG